MKPSERIKEICKEVPFEIRDTPIGYTHAIVKYLDEEYEKKQEIELEEKVCNRCGFSGVIDENNICWSDECKGR